MLENLFSTVANSMDSLPLLLAQASSLLALWNRIVVILEVALGLGFVVFVHELGHFLAAKTFGVRCDKFYVGFDVPISIGPIRLPSSLGKFQWGETEYGIGIIPLGGYVKMLGQDDDPRKAEDEAAKLRLGEGEDAPLDPRSYPAKPVWQRMIIISAGVVMNLIFAVILAGAAFWTGVPYTPTIVGSTNGGGAAWESGLQRGDQVLALGNEQDDFDKIRYTDFSTEVVIHGIEHGDEAIPLAVRRGDARVETNIIPSRKHSPDQFFRVGLNRPTTSIVARAPEDDSFLAKTNPDLIAKDEIVAVDGEQLPVDERYGKILGSELTLRLQAKWEQPVEISVQRPSEEAQSSPSVHTVSLPPVPVKSLGLDFEVGPITTIQSGSIAETAGLQVDDVIRQINGQPVENALELPSVMGRLAGQDVSVTVERPPTSDDGEPSEIEITLNNLPDASFDPIATIGGELTLGGIGVAFAATPRMQSVDQAAEDAGLKPGDELIQVHWDVSPEEKAELAEKFVSRTFEPWEIDRKFTIACLYDRLQQLPPGANLKCTVRRDGKVTGPFAVQATEAEDWYWHQRGIPMSELLDVHRASGIADAAALGVWETNRRFYGVLNFLKLLVTGQIGVNGLGGPGRIAYVAASEASYGPSRLMIFLTMLSANLAILNFLPIPALDGGHMLFLAAEAIRGKPVNEALQIRLTMLGVLGLLSLMAFVIVKDIMFFAG